MMQTLTMRQCANSPHVVCQCTGIGCWLNDPFVAAKVAANHADRLARESIEGREPEQFGFRGPAEEQNYGTADPVGMDPIELPSDCQPDH